MEKVYAKIQYIVDDISCNKIYFIDTITDKDIYNKLDILDDPIDKNGLVGYFKTDKNLYSKEEANAQILTLDNINSIGYDGIVLGNIIRRKRISRTIPLYKIDEQMRFIYALIARSSKYISENSQAIYKTDIEDLKILVKDIADPRCEMVVKEMFEYIFELIFSILDIEMGYKYNLIKTKDDLNQNPNIISSLIIDIGLSFYIRDQISNSPYSSEFRKFISNYPNFFHDKIIDIIYNTFILPR